MVTLLAFLVALGVLIAVHEYGHYRVAVACGVKVLKFSIGFGKPLFSWRRAGSPTEFSIAALPLGGYVKMLDEREGVVAPEERHLAFNQQPLRSRAAIVAAGPVANLLLAVLLYTLVNWGGLEAPQAILASPVQGSAAAKAGLVGGEFVTQAALGDDAPEDVRSFEDLRWHLTQGALNAQDVRLWVSAERVISTDNPGPTREYVLALSQLGEREVDENLMRRIGLMGPWSPPVIGEVKPGGAAAKAGLRAGDQVLKINEQTIVDSQQLRSSIRNPAGSSAQAGTVTQVWQVERAGQRLNVAVTPEVQLEAGAPVRRIWALVGGPPAMVTVQYGVLDGLWAGVVKTWDVSLLTLKMMGNMLTGEASLKNLSGPLTIADYAGKSASSGWSTYLLFLALISVSLGVLNLLPLPVLDGGHLMYYLWEAVTGRSVPEAWMERFQRGGLAILLMMMSVALFNDVMRLLA